MEDNSTSGKRPKYHIAQMAMFVVCGIILLALILAPIIVTAEITIGAVKAEADPNRIHQCYDCDTGFTIWVPLTSLTMWVPLEPTPIPRP